MDIVVIALVGMPLLLTCLNLHFYYLLKLHKDDRFSN
jgi:hypothetical protein